MYVCSNISQKIIFAQRYEMYTYLSNTKIIVFLNQNFEVSFILYCIMNNYCSMTNQICIIIVNNLICTKLLQ